jgi:tetratricopeptide (TPR) repeat protein
MKSVTLAHAITELVFAIAAREHISVGQATRRLAEKTGYVESTVYRWRQGRLVPTLKKLEELAELGAKYGLPREWGVRLLEPHHPNSRSIIERIWGPPQRRQILHNLPPPGYDRFIGKQQELNDLLKKLSPRMGINPITIDGPAGVGKTTLALEAAYRCYRVSTGEAWESEVPKFDAIIFFSCRQRILTPMGIVNIPFRSTAILSQLFRTIASVLKRPEITRAAPEDQWKKAIEALELQSTLLILDNLETVPNPERQELWAFINELPHGVRAVVTTRERVAVQSTIRLSELSEEEAIELLMHEANRKQVDLNRDDAKRIYRRLGGIPAALIYTVGQLAITGSSIDTILSRVVQPGGDVAKFCFEDAVNAIRGQPAHRLLMAIAVFPKRPLEEAALRVAGLAREPQGEEALARLNQLTLIERMGERCRMLALTREYALGELAQHPDFEREARERWVQWCIEFVEKHGGKDRENYHIGFERLEQEWENILAVVDWLANNERYDEIKAIWRNVERFARLYGHWDDLLSCLDWITQAARQRGDWNALARAWNQKARLMILIGRGYEIETEIRQEWENPRRGWLERASIARIMGCLFMQRKRYDEAEKWLKQGLDLLNRDADNADEREDQHRLRAAILSHLGECRIACEDFQGARELLNRALEQARAVRWQRSCLITQVRLAELELRDKRSGNLEQAEQLLHSTSADAERIKDRELQAFCMRFQAELAWRKGERRKAELLANEAMRHFQELGMPEESEEMQQWLNEHIYQLPG